MMSKLGNGDAPLRRVLYTSCTLRQRSSTAGFALHYAALTTHEQGRLTISAIVNLPCSADAKKELN